MLKEKLKFFCQTVLSKFQSKENCKKFAEVMIPRPFSENKTAQVQATTQFIIAFLSIFGNLFVIWAISPYNLGDVLVYLKLKNRNKKVEVDPVENCPSLSHNHHISKQHRSLRSSLQHVKRTKYVLRSKISKIMTHMAIADVFFSLLVTFGDTCWMITVEFLAPDLTCRLFQWMKLFALYASSLMVTVISLDRCLSIVYPMQMVANHKFTSIMLIAVWLTALIASFPQALIYGIATSPSHEECKQFGVEIPVVTQCVDYTLRYGECRPDIAGMLHLFYYPLTIIIQLFVPLVMTMVSFFSIFPKIKLT